MLVFDTRPLRSLEDRQAESRPILRNILVNKTVLDESSARWVVDQAGSPQDCTSTAE